MHLRPRGLDGRCRRRRGRRAGRRDAHVRARFAGEALGRRRQGGERRLRRRRSRRVDARQRAPARATRARRRPAPSASPTAASSSEPALPRAARSCASRTTRPPSSPTRRRARSTRSPSTARRHRLRRRRRAAGSTRWSQGKAESSRRSPGVDSVLRPRRRQGGHRALRRDRRRRQGRAHRGRGRVERLLQDRRSVRRLARRGAPTAPSTPGTSGKGLLYRIAAAGRATVALRLPGRGRARDRRRARTGPCAPSPTRRRRAPRATRANPRRRAATRRPHAPGSGVVPRPKPGKGALWRFDAQGRPERMMHHDEFHYVSLARRRARHAVRRAPAPRGACTRSTTRTWSRSSPTPTSARSAPSASRRAARFVVGSDPAAFHRVLSIGGADAVWTSKALDAGLRARFGHLTWRGTGALEVSTRSGDTQTPDSTWSAWSAPVAGRRRRAEPARALRAGARAPAGRDARRSPT